jgi:hypothetical protein
LISVVLYGGIVVKKEFKELQNYKKEQQVLIWVTGHCNRAAVSRNRYGVEKNVDKILINAIKFDVFLQEI